MQSEQRSAYVGNSHMSKEFSSLNHKRLSDLGFKLAFKIEVPSDCIVDNKRHIELMDADIAKRREVIYVAILEPDGECVKVGETEGTALNRWRQTLRLFKSPTNHNGEERKLRDTQKCDQRKLHKICKGRVVSVWVAEPEDIDLTLVATPQFSERVRSRHATEVFVDSVFRPSFGKDISGRNISRHEK
jgi:hypothetical protein